MLLKDTSDNIIEWEVYMSKYGKRRYVLTIGVKFLLYDHECLGFLAENFLMIRLSKQVGLIY